MKELAKFSKKKMLCQQCFGMACSIRSSACGGREAAAFSDRRSWKGVCRRKGAEKKRISLVPSKNRLSKKMKAL